eukprot:GDKI01037850.1.p1 GENE.GDKI01037850.1~~GDKI01037850.1.p1  ORF type:complete len:166 (+),score=43.04 GDKI01037850.1:169-666(+)
MANERDETCVIEVPNTTMTQREYTIPNRKRDLSMNSYRKQQYTHTQPPLANIHTIERLPTSHTPKLISDKTHTRIYSAHTTAAQSLESTPQREPFGGAMGGVCVGVGDMRTAVTAHSVLPTYTESRVRDISVRVHPSARCLSPPAASGRKVLGGRHTHTHNTTVN